MKGKGILLAFAIVLIITFLIQHSLGWPQWTMFVGTGIIMVAILLAGARRQF